MMHLPIIYKTGKFYVLQDTLALLSDFPSKDITIHPHFVDMRRTFCTGKSKHITINRPVYYSTGSKDYVLPSTEELNKSSAATITSVFSDCISEIPDHENQTAIIVFLLS